MNALKITSLSDASGNCQTQHEIDVTAPERIFHLRLAQNNHSQIWRRHSRLKGKVYIVTKMLSALVFVACILLPVTGEDEMSMRFAPSSLIPANGDFLKDNSLETCTAFIKNDKGTEPQHTHFRIKAFPIDVGDINITITGRNLGCGHNLYVSPLSPVESEQWIGRWNACHLEDKTNSGLTERCSYWCKSPGHCKETQILKVPHHLNESLWEICQITIKAKTSGDLVNLSMIPGTTCSESSMINAEYNCSHAIDGNVNPGKGNEWVSGKLTTREWILIMFPSLVGVERLEMWHRCRLEAQARVIQLDFGYDTSLLVNGTCDGSNNRLTCIGKRFSLQEFHPAVVTEWIKITSIELCRPSDIRFFGLIELKAYGRLMGKLNL